MTHHGIAFEERDAYFYGNFDDMNPREALVDDYPSLADYYFGHFYIHRDKLPVAIVEEYSLVPVMLEDTQSVIDYLQPLLGDDPIVAHSMCGFDASPLWFAVGFDVLDPEGVAHSVVYLTRKASPGIVALISDADAEYSQYVPMH